VINKKIRFGKNDIILPIHVLIAILRSIELDTRTNETVIRQYNHNDLLLSWSKLRCDI